MASSSSRPFKRIVRGELLRVRDGVGRTLVVFDGLLWITQARDPRDIFIGAGQAFTLDRPGVALVEAVVDTLLCIVDSGSDAETALPQAVSEHASV
jgi:hypothetical protein